MIHSKKDISSTSEYIYIYVCALLVDQLKKKEYTAEQTIVITKTEKEKQEEMKERKKRMNNFCLFMSSYQMNNFINANIIE